MSTSTQAKKNFDKGNSKALHHKIILGLLRIGGQYSASQIAGKTKLSYHQVSRRTSELIDLNLIGITKRAIVHPHKTAVNIYASTKN